MTDTTIIKKPPPIDYMVGRTVNIQDGPDKTYFIIRGIRLTDPYEIKLQNEQFGKTLDGFYYYPDKKEWYYKYPQEFVAPSNNDKYLIFQYCRATEDKSTHTEIEVHADFIPRDEYCDHLVYYANLPVPDDNRKYKMNDNRKTGFSVWFTNGKGRGKAIGPVDMIETTYKYVETSYSLKEGEKFISLTESNEHTEKVDKLPDKIEGTYGSTKKIIKITTIHKLTKYDNRIEPDDFVIFLKLIY